MLFVLSVLLCVDFKLTNKEIFCSFVLKRKYVFNCYVVASLLRKIFDNNVSQFIYNLINSKFSLTYYLDKLS